MSLLRSPHLFTCSGMVLSTKMTVRRRSGMALVIGATVWAFLMGPAKAQDNATCGAVAPPYPIPPEDPRPAENLGAEFMAPFVRSFLHTVQPNPFPRGRCFYWNYSLHWNKNLGCLLPHHTSSHLAGTRHKLFCCCSISSHLNASEILCLLRPILVNRPGPFPLL